MTPVTYTSNLMTLGSSSVNDASMSVNDSSRVTLGIVASLLQLSLFIVEATGD